MVKHLLFILGAICFFSINAQNISDLEAYEKAVKPGAQLTYDVSAGGKQYQLIVTLKKIGDEIAYDWKTTAPDNKSGSVSMLASTAQTTALFSNFAGGDTKLDKETSLCISKKTFNEVASTAQAKLKVYGNTDTLTTLGNTIGEFNFNLNGALVAIPGWELQGGSEIKYTIDVLESTKLPLIYKLDIGWSAILTEVKNQ